ncbi:hypothetical protein JHS3_29350 [Jeongeupia sp. HS-3]|nr:hypothetical protein JHS3_29350 [Jeongeupia sp. HS-3]
MLVIVGMLLAGALQAARVMGEAQRVRDTRSELAEIREALLGFAVREGHLPCPADPAATGAAIGVEDRSGDVCNRFQGLLPWVALGLGQTDAFGRPFSYRVTDFYANTDGKSFGGCGGNSPPAGVSFAMCSLGDINIFSAAVAGQDLARNVVAVVVSHGSYGPGPLQAGGVGDEAENADNDREFVSRERVDGADGVAVYDDLTDWLPPATLLSRMLLAGRLP